MAYLLIYFRNQGAIKKALTILNTIGSLKEVIMVLFLRNKRFNYAFLDRLLFEVVEITNWGARLPQNRFGWRWLLFEELWTPYLIGHTNKQTNLSVCLFVLISDHNSWTPWSICLKFWFENLRDRKCSQIGFEILNWGGPLSPLS